MRLLVSNQLNESNDERTFLYFATVNVAHCFHDTGIGPKELDILLHAHVLDLNTNQAYNSLPPGSNPPSG